MEEGEEEEDEEEEESEESEVRVRTQTCLLLPARSLFTCWPRRDQT